MIARGRPGLALLAVFTLMLPFQNCDGGLKSQNGINSQSAQCRAQAKVDGVAAILTGQLQPHCASLTEYSCERRLFSPDVDSLTHEVIECIGDDQTCVAMTIRQFNTSAAKKFESWEKFLPGGPYNREEVTCRHSSRFKGSALFEETAESLEVALAHVIDDCERGSGK